MIEQCETEITDKELIKDDSDVSQAKLLTIKQFCSVFPWPSESAMRSYIYRAEELGISKAFVRVRRRVLIMPKSFFLLIRQIENNSTKGGVCETTSWRKGKAYV